MTSVERLRDVLRGTPCWGWLEDAITRPEGVARAFSSAGRRAGRASLTAVPGWTADEAARTLLLAALPPGRVAEESAALYRYGDADEKRAVLKSLPLLPIGDEAVPLLHDAIRSNDARLLAAALGPCAVHLDAAVWRQAVLKCVFTGVPLAAVHDLDRRADTALAAMLAAFADEREAAGRPVPADAAALLHRLTGDPPGDRPGRLTGDPSGDRPGRPAGDPPGDLTSSPSAPRATTGDLTREET